MLYFKYLFPVLFCFYSVTLKAYSLRTIDITVTLNNDARSLNEVKQIILNGIVEDSLTAYTDKTLYINFRLEGVPSKKIEQHDLKNKRMVALKTTLDWNIAEQKGEILSYCPIFEPFEDSVFFYVEANVHVFGIRLSAMVSQEVKTSMINTLNKDVSMHVPENYSIRQVIPSEYNCMMQADLADLPRWIVADLMEGAITGFEGYECADGMFLSYREVEKLTWDGNEKQKQCKAILIAERWNDSTYTVSKSYNFKAIGASEYDFKKSLLTKELTSFGLVFDDNTTIWITAEDYNGITFIPQLPDWNYICAIYNQYMDASFCKKLNME